MRTFETYLAIACVTAIVWPALFGVRPRRGIVAVALPAAIIVQWQIEGFRWPLLILYLVALGLAVGDFVTLERHLPWYRRAGRAVFGPIGLGLAISPALLFPVPELPIPSGPLAIGTTTAELTHPELRETYGAAPGRRRTIKAQIWYPAHPDADERPLPWEPDIDVVAPALADRVGLPGFIFNSARYTSSSSYPDAPVAEGGFPLVIFSHDWEGFRSIVLSQVENLVSQGYVVVAIDHTFAAVATVIGGEPRLLDEDALGEPDADDDARAEAEVEMIEIFAADIGLVLDEIAEGSEGAFGPAGGAADNTVVGLWGHGIGGAAALQVCLVDARCDAVVGLDPRVENLPDQVLAATATRPMLLMRSDPHRGTPNDAVLRGIVARSETITYWVDVFGADTGDFVSAPLVSPIAAQLGLRGPIDADRAIAINRRFITGFFDRFLLGTGSAALDTATFSEVDVEIIDRRG